MRKILLAFLLLTIPAQDGFCTVQWNKGAPAATDIKSIWPATSQANNSILDSLLQNYKRGLYLNYSSATALSIGAGEVVVSNVTGSARLFLVATTPTSITSSNLDTGSFSSSTTYYVYAGTSTVTDSAPTFYISLSSSAPSGVTYYAQLGNFTMDSSTNISALVDNYGSTSYVGTKQSKSSNVIYQALTDGIFEATMICNNGGHGAEIATDSSSTPTTDVANVYNGSSGSFNYMPLMFPIRKGDYYELITSGCTDLSGSGVPPYFIPTGK